jgi:hypothetical protein
MGDLSGNRGSVTYQKSYLYGRCRCHKIENFPLIKYLILQQRKISFVEIEVMLVEKCKSA